MKKTILPLKSIHYVYIAVGIFSAIIFCTIYGVKIINPMYTDWLFCEGEDLAQHYLGWVAYRNSAWHFPLGMADTLAYPHRTSVIFTDSIPLMAVFFKILSPILPQNFQYFGLWGILCFALQGILTARIIKNYTDDNASLILISIIFLYTPVMLFRMYIHTALAGQWIILLGLEPIFAQEKYRNNKKIYIVVALMGVLSAFIHLYFVLISGIILVGICLADIMVHRRLLRSILLIIEYVCAAIIVVWVLGGLEGQNHATAGGLGRLSLNLNAFVNPMGWSCIFKELPLKYEERQREGFAWLGAGFIFLMPLCAILFSGCGRARQICKKYMKVLIPLCIVAGIAILTALSPTVTIGSKVLLRIKLPIPISDAWGIFRCTGRIAWVSVYIMMVCACIIANKILNKKTFIILIIFGLFLQIYDSHEFIAATSKRYNSPRVYESALEGDLWNWAAANEEIEHIVYCSPREGDALYRLTDWALKHNKTMNTFYFARPNDLIDESTAKSLNNPALNELFVFIEADLYRCMDYKLHYYAADGLIVGYAHNIDGLEQLLDGSVAHSYKDQNECMADFVDRLYRQTLNRAGDDQEIERWCRMILQRELDIESVAYSFIDSSELLGSGCTDEEFIRIMYGIFLNRECDSAGFNGWMEKMSQGMDREGVFQEFARSEEFRSMMEEGGVMSYWITSD